MSRENVELVRAIFEDFRAATSESDWEGTLTRTAEVWDPESECEYFGEIAMVPLVSNGGRTPAITS